MRWINRLRLRLRSLLRPAGIEEELNTELQFHLDQQIEENLAAGMTPDEARSSASRSVGSVLLIKEECRESLGLRLLDELRQDMRYASRALVKNPTFTIVAVITLTLGVGATTAIFSVVNAVLLKPLPYRDSDRFMRLMMNVPAGESPTKKPLRAALGLTAAEMFEVQSHVRSLSHVGTAGQVLRGFTGKDGAARLQGARVSSTIFEMLGTRPLIGRVVSAADEAPGAEGVILLSNASWQRFFGGDPNILGRTMTQDSVLGPRTQYHAVIIGVMPQSFEFPDRQTQFWIPFQATGAGRPPVRGPMVARLADGVSIPAASAEVGSILHELRPQAPTTRYELVSDQDELVAPVKPALVVLSVAVGFVLLIACVNVANLLLGRTAAKERELAIRTAIGAGRWRLIRQMLTESVILASLGGVAGIGLAFGGVHLLKGLLTTLPRPDLPSGLVFPRLDEIRVDGYVLAFTAGICLISGLVSGLVPAITQAGSNPMEALKGASARSRFTSDFVRWFGLRDVLVIAEVGMAMVLLVGGGLLVHSFVRLSSVDPGYKSSSVLTFQVSLPVDSYPDERLKTFAEDLVARLRSVPRVRAAGYANQLPMVNLFDTGGGLWRTPDAKRGPSPIGPDFRFVSRDYFDVMGIHLIAGRAFEQRDSEGQPRVLLVNKAAAQHDFEGENPIGKLVYIGRDVVPWQIVGIVDDVRQFGLDREPEPQIFADLRQWSGSVPLFPVGAYYSVRTDGDPMAIISTVRGMLRDLEAQAVLFNVAPMDQLVAATISRPRLYAVLIGIFASVGVALALVGIYGVLAYFVTQRTREIGIRVSLGARRSDVMYLVLRQSVMLTSVGLGIGVASAAAMSRFLEGLLFGLKPLDSATFLSVCALFVLVATCASYVPARRATKVDPMVALRSE